MSYREVVMTVAIIAYVYFMYKSINDIEDYDRAKGMDKWKKAILIRISVLIPLIGFILTRRYANINQHS